MRNEERNPSPAHSIRTREADVVDKKYERNSFVNRFILCDHDLLRQEW